MPAGQREPSWLRRRFWAARADGAGCVFRAELRQYLDEGGVLDAWSKCLTALYQEREKPENPIE